MEVRAAPSLTSPPDAVSTKCRIVVSYDWSTTAIQVLDYYPYGSTRVNQTTGGFNEGKQFIGQYSDPETNLSYLQARCYDGSKGEFLSEDPVFRGDSKQQNLRDPQSLNSYSYANDNPITKSDPNGRWRPIQPRPQAPAGLVDGLEAPACPGIAGRGEYRAVWAP
jgi:RHS repeat-associated protein